MFVVLVFDLRPFGSSGISQARIPCSPMLRLAWLGFLALGAASESVAARNLEAAKKDIDSWLSSGWLLGL